jgi:hypothetical protein
MRHDPVLRNGVGADGRKRLFHMLRFDHGALRIAISEREQHEPLLQHGFELRRTGTERLKRIDRGARFSWTSKLQQRRRAAGCLCRSAACCGSQRRFDPEPVQQIDGSIKPAAVHRIRAWPLFRGIKRARLVPFERCSFGAKT